MSRLNGKGPENKGSGTGRSLGNCCKNSEKNSTKYKLGQGMGKRRKAGIIENKNQDNNYN
ncbi:MAG TPA: DUF5320 family protein [Paludibacteraceae bacterium]|nr:DUF5320 family protein [Paludibacteraceae bacterium]